MATKFSKTLGKKGKQTTTSTRKQVEEIAAQAVIPFDAKPPKPTKKHIITNMENVSTEVLELLQTKYPLGWRHHVIKVNKSSTDYFYAITLDTPTIDYLIKVNVEIDSKQKLEEDRTIYGGYDDVDEDTTDEGLPSKDDEAIADESPDDEI